MKYEQFLAVEDKPIGWKKTWSAEDKTTKSEIHMSVFYGDSSPKDKIRKALIVVKIHIIFVGIFSMVQDV